tara:strand:+ start:694 stop:918 length:225 start_codon:yes stop_codon:yes gene_type:complete
MSEENKTQTEEEGTADTPENNWQAALCNLAVAGNKHDFLNENGIRTINFLFDNVLYDVTISAQPSNIIPFPKNE